MLAFSSFCEQHSTVQFSVFASYTAAAVFVKKPFVYLASLTATTGRVGCGSGS